MIVACGVFLVASLLATTFVAQLERDRLRSDDGTRPRIDSRPWYGTPQDTRRG
jgi:hypothetical protein